MSRPIPLHPLLAAAFPILFLFAHNASEVLPRDVVRPLLLSVGATLFLLLALRVVVKDMRKAALPVSLFVVLFYSYGHRVAVVSQILDMSTVAAHLGIFVLDAAALGGAGWLILRSQNDLRRATASLNLAAAILIAMPTGLGAYRVAARNTEPLRVTVPDAIARKTNTRPDIYYIILDGYAREDILRDNFGYDNSKFVGYLRRRGFYVADQSVANYSQTILSLASSLNMGYLDGVAQRLGEQSHDRVPLVQTIEKSHVIDFLKKQGYTIVSFSSGYYGTEIRSADLYLCPPWALTEFENVLISSTLIDDHLSALQQRWRWLGKVRVPSQYASHRYRIRYIFDRLGRIKGVRSPIFVFAHIMCPHRPFVFDQRGNPVKLQGAWSLGDGVDFKGSDLKQDVSLYMEQLAFVSAQTRLAIERILSNSSTPPVIVIQSDHGIWWTGPQSRGKSTSKVRARMSILNAYYLPGGVPEDLYPRITPVNTFRLVFRDCFDADYELLEDRSYLSFYRRPYKFADVTAEVQH